MLAREYLRAVTSNYLIIDRHIQKYCFKGKCKTPKPTLSKATSFCVPVLDFPTNTIVFLYTI